jgi:hypothetical protein
MQKKYVLKIAKSMTFSPVMTGLKRIYNTLFIWLIALFLFFGVSDVFGQCTAYTTNTACTTAAPTSIGASISCTPPTNNGGRRNFFVTDMIAGNTYRISNCGSGFDTQMTIRDTGGNVVAYNDDNGPACTGSEASIDFIPTANGNYRIQLNRYNCATANVSNGTILVTLTATSTPPTITSLGASSGCSGSSLVITGTNLSGATAVTIGGTAATITATTATTVTVTVGAGTTGTIQVTTPGGTATSSGSFTVSSAPVIGTQPVVTSICTSGTGTFSVVATGATTYQWRRAGVNLTNTAPYSGVNTATLTITNPAIGDAGNFDVIVSNGSCSVTSTARALTVLLTTPSITTNPTSVSVAGGANTSFTAAASNSPTSYIWEVSTNGGTSWATISNGGVYSTATTATLTITGATFGMNGYRYRASATNSCGTSLSSSSATLTVTYCTPTSTNTSDYISGFSTTGGVTNISNSPTTLSGTGYGNFYSTFSASQYAGSVLNFTETYVGGSHGLSIWVDFNNNGAFEVGERLYNAAATATGFTGSITIPGGTAAGDYRMRVRAWWNNLSPDPCSNISYGEAEDYKLTVLALLPCSGTPVGGSVTVAPIAGAPGSTYGVTASGYSSGTGLTFQWQFSTNAGATWSNVGAASGTYSNYTATAPSLGTTVIWKLIVTCANSGVSSTSTTASFTSVSTQNIPTTGNNTVACGTNIVLYDNGGVSGNYANSSNGYTVLEAGLGATINISGNYVTESFDYIRIYNGSGTTGTLLATYSGTGTINYTGTAGQTLTIRFSSDGSIVYSGFTLSVSYSGVCFPVCTGAPSGGTVTTNPNTGWPGSAYVVSSTGYTNATGLIYQWQYSTDGGTSWLNAGASSSAYSNYSATAPASGLVQWQLDVTCTNSGQISTSSIGIYTTIEVSDVVTGCPNVVSGGLGLDGADPAIIYCTATSTCVDLEATYLDLGETTNYIVEPIAYNPPFSFSGLANPVSVNTDDVWSPIVNLPFDFCFYGNTYNKCVIGSNGVLTFDTSVAGGLSGYSFSANIPISGDPRLIENSIFGVFHDIDPGVGGEVGWELITLPSGCRALVASWSDVPMFDENSILYSGMMVLYENSNIIEVYIKEKNIDNFGAGTWNDGNAVLGIQNATGTLASVAPGRNGLDTNWATANEAWRFVPSGNSIASIAWHEGSGITGPIVGTTPTLSVCPTSTTTYTAEITYTLCDGRTIKESDETTVTINSAKVWNGSVSTNWNIANNWTPSGVPSATDCVVIADTANDPIITGSNFNALSLNLTINNNANLTVTSDNYLTVTDWVNINSTGDLVLQNSASLIQTNNELNQGTMHMTRTTNIRKLDYVYWSSPVTSFNLNNVSPGTTGYKYKWTPTIPSNTNGFGNWTAANETMIRGKGYIVRGPDNFTSTIAPFNAVFSGTPNNGTITIPISRGTWNGGNYSTGVSTTLGTNNDDNWNLIGNPYPSAINAIEFLTLNTNVAGFINIWTHGTLPGSAAADPFYNDYVYNYTPSDYITFNSSGSSAGPGTYGGNIGAGQGFFVLMNHTSGTSTENVTFNNTMRSRSHNNNEFYRTSNENGRIWLDLIASNGSNIRNLVAYVANATNNRDRMYDAITSEKLSLNLYSSIGNEIMKIQGRSIPFDENDRVPMGIKVPQNGNYSIAIGAVDGFFTNVNQNIYLEDNLTNVIHDLRQNPYSFSATTGNYPNRFVLRYTNETLDQDDPSADEANLWVISLETLVIKSTKNEIESVRVFDVLGRELANYPKVNSYEISLTNIQKNNTGLIIQVTLSNGAMISKKVIY